MPARTHGNKEKLFSWASTKGGGVLFLFGKHLVARSVGRSVAMPCRLRPPSSLLPLVPPARPPRRRRAPASSPASAFFSRFTSSRLRRRLAWQWIDHHSLFLNDDDDDDDDGGKKHARPPITLFIGDKDPIVTLSDVRELGDRLACDSVLLYDGSGHEPFAPDRFGRHDKNKARYLRDVAAIVTDVATTNEDHQKKKTTDWMRLGPDLLPRW
mmetsp:Transcript_4209/g.13087  ORF Transcript_4209/g.13087 Transcript_4209/m.13087 type:complete len:212 (+) Transcript_4209:2591-3226(+)